MLIEHAWKNHWEIYDIYSDDDYAGADRNRPQFKRLLADAEAHKFDIILCKTQSRFTRELELVEKYDIDTQEMLIEKLSKLDDKGIHTVATVLEMEHMRCQAEAEAVALAEKNAKIEAAKINPLINNDQLPSKSDVTDLLKALND